MALGHSLLGPTLTGTFPPPPFSSNSSSDLVIEKRRLELELFRNQQIKQRSDNDKEILSAKISKLRDNIQSYSDVNKLKSQIEVKLETAKQGSSQIKQEIEELKIANEKMVSEIREIKLELDRNSQMKEIGQLESRLRELLRVNERLKANNSGQMMSEIKSVVLDCVKKYNQNLMGF